MNISFEDFERSLKEYDAILREKDNIIVCLKTKIEKLSNELKRKDDDINTLREEKLSNHKEIGKLQIKLNIAQAQSPLSLKKNKSEVKLFE